jgi:hypothetical protein
MNNKICNINRSLVFVGGYAPLPATSRAARGLP